MRKRPSPERGRAKRRFFDALAETWDQEVSLKESHAALKRILKPWELLFGEARILDAGCGTGHLTSWLVRLPKPPRFVAALDASAAMLRKLRARIPDNPSLQASAEALPFREDSFHFVLAMGLYPHLEDRTAFFRECLRVLRPGGWLLVFHTAGRDRINMVHRKAGPPVAKDRLPAATRTMEELLEAGFLAGPWMDDLETWLVSGMKEGE